MKLLKKLLPSMRKQKLLDARLALASFLTSKQLSAIELQTPDRRELIRAAACVVGTSEEQLTERIAARIGLPAMLRIPPMDYQLLEDKIALERLEAIGCAVITSGGIIGGVVCVEPAVLGTVSTIFGDTPKYLGTWSAISRTLSDARSSFQAAKEELQRTKAKKLIELAERALTLAITNAITHHATELTISKNKDDQLEYQILTKDLKSAVGAINKQVAPALTTLLKERASRRDPDEVTLSDGQIISYQVDMQTSGRGFRVEIHTAAKKSKVVYLTPVEHAKPIDSPTSVSPQPPPKDESDQSQSPKSTRAREVLLVEDGGQFAAILSKMLQKHSYIVKHASTGLEALTAVESGTVNPDLVICDVHMPEMNGFGFVRRLRTIQKFIQTPVIMLTSDDEDETHIRALSEGADAFVAKHEHPDILLAHVKRCLSRSNHLNAA